MQLEVIYDTPGDQRKEGEAPCIVEALTSYLGRARKSGLKYAPLLLRIHKNGAITGGFTSLLT